MKISYDFLCLDERDSPNLSELRNKTTKEIKKTKNRRYFGICGVIIPGAIYPDINVEGRRIQQKCFSATNYKPFHYVEILNNSHNFAFLGKDKHKKNSLISLLNNFISQTKFKIIASFIDKQELSLQYGVFKNKQLAEIRRIKPNMSKPSTPRKINLYELSLKFILSEYYKYLKEHKKRGLIIAEARGELEDINLLNAFYYYQKSGVGNLSARELRQYITDLLIIRKSQNHIGLQIADLITYPLYDFFVPNHNTRKDHFIKRESFEKKIISVNIFPKIRKGA